MQKSDLYITAFCDGSYCPMTGAYGYAYWIKWGYPAQTIRMAGSGRGHIASEQCERLALKQTIRRIATLPIKDKRIIIQSDCLDAIRMADVRALRTFARAVAVKHVKGHKGMLDTRSAVNTICDREARRRMKEVRLAIYLENEQKAFTSNKAESSLPVVSLGESS